MTNADNRLIASAVRLAIEQPLGRLLTQEQRGFLPGRSMVSNLIDVEEAMYHYALEHDDAVGIFLTVRPPFQASLMICYSLILGPWAGPLAPANYSRAVYQQFLSDCV